MIELLNVTIRSVAVVVLQELLVLPLEVLFEDDAADLESRMLVSEAGFLLAKRRVQIRIVVDIAWATDYGRSGSGVAVGFYPERLTQPPYDLFRIVYRQDAQVETINTIVRTIDDALGESLPTIEDEHQRDRLKAVAADLAADHLWMASPKLKHPSFEAEEEWRLIAYELRGPGAPHGKGPAGETHFRASAGRVIPFKELSFETLPAFEVVFGSSCPMGPDDLGVLVRMEERLGARLTVRVSDVPVRT